VGLVLLGGASACSELNANTFIPLETDDTATLACPAGQAPASFADLEFTTFTINGLTMFAGFDPEGVYEGGVAPACVSPDGSALTMQVELALMHYGTLSMSGAVEGTQVVGEYTGAVILDLFGDEPPVTYTNVDWFQGTWTVNTLGSPSDMSFSGNALKETAVDNSAGDVEVQSVVTNFALIIEP
jgi:hypothetical protein